MTLELKEFLIELSELLDKHHINSVEAVDNDVDYYPSVDGIEIDIASDYKKSPPREWMSVRLPKSFDGESLRSWVSNQLLKKDN